MSTRTNPRRKHNDHQKNGERLNPQIASGLHLLLQGVKVKHDFPSCLTLDPPSRGQRLQNKAKRGNIKRRRRRLPMDGRKWYYLLSYKRLSKNAKQRSMVNNPAGLPPRCCAIRAPSRCGRRSHLPYIAAVCGPAAAEKTAPKLLNRLKCVGKHRLYDF